MPPILSSVNNDLEYVLSKLLSFFRENHIDIIIQYINDELANIKKQNIYLLLAIISICLISFFVPKIIKYRIKKEKENVEEFLKNKK